MFTEFVYTALIAGFILVVLLGHVVLLKAFFFRPRSSKSPATPR
jgi:hypothetical protein